MAEARFVGDGSCRECHPAEVEKQAKTAHAATLRPMDRVSLGKLAPPAGRVPKSDIVLHETPDGRYSLGVAGEAGDPLPLSFAVGSGKTGMTHVAMMEDNQLLELGRSYFPGRKRWYTTPGHEKQGAEQIGLMYRPEQARQCFLCHAVTVPANGVVPHPAFYGVGCEACHGPASVHVEAARSSGGQVAGTMEKIGAWKADRINNLCGRCHRTQQTVAVESTQTNRFQAFGLMKSRCFKESGGQLSCMTCHDPHSNTSHDKKTYEAACLKCHSAPTSTAAAPASTASAVGKVCPVNPREGCVPCHMPKRAVFKNVEIPTQMADHLIAVHKKPAR